MNKQILPALFIIGVVGVIGYFLFQQDQPDQNTQNDHQSQQTDVTKPSSDQGQLKIEDLKIGEGADAVSGKEVTVHYVGTLHDGTVFDSSRDRNEPFNFILGTGQVIKGWDEGVVGMKVGGVRKLTIPPDLGYGSVDLGKIPPNSTLLFEVELLEVK